MQIGEILLLATIALVLIGGLVALGIGHRRWNIGTVVAGFLVLLAAATYLYLSARLASRERAWTQKVADYQRRLATAEDPAPAADLAPGPQSLDRMRIQRDRWRRGRDRVETWHGRVWRGATFQPPQDDAAAGRVELAAEANAEDSPPIGEGSHVFLFDTFPLEEGGAYLGEFFVKGTSYDQATKRHVLEVVQTAPRDPYDTKVLGRPHDSVTVFEDLPVDRWLAFYRSRPLDGEVDDAASLPETVKEDAEKVGELLKSAPEVGALVEDFVEAFTRHDEEVPKEEWDAAATEAAAQPGTLWAEVEFTKPHRIGPEAEGEAPAEEDVEGGPKRDFEEGDRMLFDLQTALELRDRDQVVTIERVVRRRPLADAMTLLHGAQTPIGEGPDGGVRADGTASLRRLIQNEIDALDLSKQRLQKALDDTGATTKDHERVAAELEQDLRSWHRDARAATDLAAGFERELGRNARALEAAEAAIVEHGRELTAAMDRLARKIDQAAPPPERRAARP